ncbi:LppM family (lipo)protein [Actinomyces slackii]|uniref:LppM domain-containing protein n=2 Tax=Actinomyces slackii TaxID=52774 RepID=A0A3S4WF67_9ACTO|nr:hypothetical protein [Actinomyces slackii]VEG73547.1 Uncharacterised protein [Actinomyces slackii]
MSKTLTTLVAPVRRGLLAAGLVGLLSVSALLPAVGHAQPLPTSSDSSSSADMSAELSLTIKSDDTVVSKSVVTDKSDYNFLTEENCTADSFTLNGADESKTEASASFEDKGDSRACTVEGTYKIEDLEGITHEGDEYVVKLDGPGSSSSDSFDVKVSITFPGKVTEADGGTVDGNTVTLTSLDHTVRGKDSPGLPWLWLGLGLVVLLAVGGGVAGVLVSQNKKKKAAAAAQAGGYVAQPLPGQVPGQQAQAPGYSPTQPLQSNPYPPQGQAPGYPPAQPPYQG